MAYRCGLNIAARKLLQRLAKKKKGISFQNLKDLITWGRSGPPPSHFFKSWFFILFFKAGNIWNDFISKFLTLFQVQLDHSSLSYYSIQYNEWPLLSWLIVTPVLSQSASSSPSRSRFRLSSARSESRPAGYHKRTCSRCYLLMENPKTEW